MNKDEYRLYSQVEDKHWWFRARREILKEIMLEISNKQNKSVLDVGCGVGGNLQMLYNSFNRADGIDNDPEAVRYARIRGDNMVKLLDASALLSIEKKYDVVSFLDVLYHKKIVDYIQVLKDAKIILYDDGYILISDGAFDFLAGQHSKFVQGSRRFTKKQLISDLENLGYEIIVSKYWGFLMFFLLFIKRRIFERMPFYKVKSSDVKDVSIFTNSIMYWCVSWERVIIKYFDLPVGSSILILARKK